MSLTWSPFLNNQSGDLDPERCGGVQEAAFIQHWDVAGLQTTHTSRSLILKLPLYIYATEP